VIYGFVAQMFNRRPADLPPEDDAVAPGPEKGIPVRYLRRFHAAMTAVWIALLVPSLLWWKDSILWVIVMSVWANVASHFGAWQGARAEDAATPGE